MQIVASGVGEKQKYIEFGRLVWVGVGLRENKSKLQENE